MAIRRFVYRIDILPETREARFLFYKIPGIKEEIVPQMNQDDFHRDGCGGPKNPLWDALIEVETLSIPPSEIRQVKEKKYPIANEKIISVPNNSSNTPTVPQKYSECPESPIKKAKLFLSPSKDTDSKHGGGS